ncbi:adenosylcobinamide-GDP ribazoletransferase [uncultured Sulfitobacter sp.]|uniref:adenosylcobinamide-GDP ribazoletransferase n=1 Tax=uncultured Sulfitobacter sp. TaxID=191468 RepID=UPI002631B5ED|nr:adenosylcobinamide-GDP ribazoletransferase [uncultured Sulfitobacter sp.]
MRKINALQAAKTDIWLAAVLLTRLPLPHLPRTAFDNSTRAVWAYPLVGAVVGLASALAGQAALLMGLPATAAAAISLGCMMLLTGAMHEDGLADLFDGFWGATTPERRLQIMRDSQIGTYGTLALVMVTVLRWSALTVLLPHGITVIIVASALSRAMMAPLMSFLPYARRDGLAHSVGRPSASMAFGTLAVGTGIGVLATGGFAILGLASVIVVAAVIAGIARRKIKGHTGDVLGAVQQLTETAVLLTGTALIL